MSNPFEDENATYVSLQNDEGQYSLWRADIKIPDGWSTRFGPESRANCVAYIEEHWTDMRPNSLIQAMEKVVDES